jgi:ribosomal protein L32
MRGVGSAAFALGKALVNAVPVGVLAMMKMRLSAHAVAAKRATPARMTGKTRTAGRICMRGREKEKVMAEFATGNKGRFRGEIRRLWGAS